MSEPSLIRRQRDFLKKLAELAAERARVEPSLVQTRQEQRTAGKAAAQQTLQEATRRTQADNEAAADYLLDADMPLVYGMSNVTCEAQREAVSLAELIGGVIDSHTSL